MKRDWKKAGRNRHGYESAAPKAERVPGPHTNVKRKPVKTWAQMTEAERAAVLAALKNGGKP